MIEKKCTIYRYCQIPEMVHEIATLSDEDVNNTEVKITLEEAKITLKT